MVKHVIAGTFSAAALAIGIWTLATTTPAQAQPDSPTQLRALYITGGGWHDYPAQQTILTEGIGKRIHISWEIDDSAGSQSDVVIDRFKRDDWADGFDVVVYNKCHSGVSDVAVVEAIADHHHQTGLPAVFLHCAIHSFRAPTDKWFRFGGVTSHRHERHRPFLVEALQPEHPVMIGFPEEGWQTPEGELYEIVHVWDTATPLAHSYGVDTEKHHVNIWVNQYGNARVFGTTIGHHNETMADPVYLDLVTRGLLWSVNKLDGNGQPTDDLGR